MEETKEKLNLPSTLLMVTGGINVLLLVLGIILAVIQAILGRPLFQSTDVGTINMGGKAVVVTQTTSSGGMLMQSLLNIVIDLAFIVISAVIIYGAMKMKNARSYGLAMASAILAAIPLCSLPCCCLGTPIGIWALVILMNADVKAAFR